MSSIKDFLEKYKSIYKTLDDEGIRIFIEDVVSLLGEKGDMVDVKESIYQQIKDIINDISSKTNGEYLSVTNEIENILNLFTQIYDFRKIYNPILFDDVYGTDYKAGFTVYANYLRELQSKSKSNFYRKLRVGTEKFLINCMGDSLTFGFDSISSNTNYITYTYDDGSEYTAKQSPTTYPKALQTILNSTYTGNRFTVINKGRGGDWAEAGFKRTFKDSGADLSVIMYGSNDVAASGCEYKENPETFSYWLEQIIIREILWGKAVLLLIPPTHIAGTTVSLDVLSPIYRGLAEKYNCGLIDLQQCLEGIKPEYYSDNIHFTNVGYSCIGDRVATGIISEGLSEIPQVIGGTVLSSNPLKGNFVNFANCVSMTTVNTTTDSSNNVNGKGFQVRFSTTGDTCTYVFETLVDNVIVIPSMYIPSSSTVEIALDNNTRFNVPLKSSYLRAVQANCDEVDYAARVTISGVTCRYNKAYCIANKQSPLVIPNRGLHRLTITLKGCVDGSDVNSNNARLYGIEFVNWDLFGLLKA